MESEDPVSHLDNLEVEYFLESGSPQIGISPWLDHVGVSGSWFKCVWVTVEMDSFCLDVCNDTVTKVYEPVLF
jgi:hypothetical protein